MLFFVFVLHFYQMQGPFLISPFHHASWNSVSAYLHLARILNYRLVFSLELDNALKKYAQSRELCWVTCPANTALEISDMEFTRCMSYKFPQKKNVKVWVLDKKEAGKGIVASSSVLNYFN